MKILVDSFEYQCWHEVGHATVCLHVRGDVESIELLTGDVRGYAVAHCVVMPEAQRSVACGGFAAEFFLLKHGYAEQARSDDRDIHQVVFHNATHDREAFFERKLGKDEAFTETEDIEFRNHAIGPQGEDGAVPIFREYFFEMQELVRELRDARRVEGRRVRELLRRVITR